MSVIDLIPKSTQMLERSSTLQEAARLMQQEHVGAIVITGSKRDRKPVGIITDRDIAMTYLHENLSHKANVGEVMSTNVIKIRSTDGIANAVDLMEREGIRRIVVVEDNGDTRGLISLDDIVSLVAQEVHGLGRVILRQHAKGAKSLSYQDVMMT